MDLELCVSHLHASGFNFMYTLCRLQFGAAALQRDPTVHAFCKLSRKEYKA